MDNLDKYTGAVLDDRYEIQERIGIGGMAIVYRAVDRRLGRSVAAKILKDDFVGDVQFRDKFFSEAQAVAKLSHPNIVSVFDVSRSGDIEYIIMELIDGITLKQYMKKKGALGWKEALHFSVQISKALVHAHSKGIVHRDIKPQNIMILRDGTIKVADFGIAALENSRAGRSDIAEGSVHYIAPEQARGEVPDARSDVYSLGVVMYEMLTGELPYDGRDTEEVARKHISGGAKKLREVNRSVPAELERITLKAMCSDINCRYASAEDLLDDLEKYLKLQSALLSMKKPEAPRDDADVGLTDEEGLLRDVKPISSEGEMSRESYRRRRRRSRKVSLLTGIFGVFVFIIAVFIFLWNYWLKDIFSVAERINMPDFTGCRYEEIVNNRDFRELFNFSVKIEVAPEAEEGLIVRQDPEADRSLMVLPEKIDVTLFVSAGVVETEIPDVLNWQYQEATLELQNAGFAVEEIREASNSVTEDYVISTNPAPGESMPAGSTVYVTISVGPKIQVVTMPNLMGFPEATALERLESAGLTGSVTYVNSSYDAGVVIKQSIAAYEDVEEHSTVNLWVSLGPEKSDEPGPEDAG